jgi:hypothetical protein
MIPALSFIRFQLSEVTMKGLLEKEIAVEREVVSEDRPLSISKKVQGQHSICTTCLYNGHCAYQGRSTEPVLFCEEFETETGNLNQSEILSKQTIDPENLFKGLCANCENRKTCMFADSISGVWHCEEYK